MSLRKKIVWLPYDFDTAIGINNEGGLVFSYNLEDIDHQAGGADIYNGQQSVIWNNLRDAFGPELKAMYKTLRSSGALSYDKVEKMFEDHQEKWCEAIFNEDAWFKYIQPLIEDGDGAYLAMLQGSKAEQRKWWLYNRFRYIDSKYIAGDSLTDTITLRPYAASNISITPYADIYATIAWDANITQERCARNTTATLICPYDTMNDNVVTIYSASQLASVGDLSPLKVGYANFASATKLQSIKVGDSSSSYDNQNFSALELGNNVLLKTLDVRNCSGLGNTAIPNHIQTSVDVSHCPIIENIYFQGTNIKGIELPNGGVIKTLHLPSTITNLTILNQKNITDFSIGSYSNISTLRLENTPTLDTFDILSNIPAGTRVRLIGFVCECENVTEIETILDKLDLMRGLDESGGNVDTAQVSGIIHTSSLTGDQIDSFNARYPFITFTADNLITTIKFMTWDGNSLYTTRSCVNGVMQGTIPTAPDRNPSEWYTYTPVGWNLSQDATTNDEDACLNVTTNRTVYAAYSRTAKTYTVRFYNGDTLLQTETVSAGNNATYTGETPTYSSGAFLGWNPEPIVVLSDIDCVAIFDFEMVEPDLKYLVYTKDEINKTITITGLNTSQIVTDNLEYITIPDTIDGYHVILN